jgi:predicted RNA binding protein YcfA (HicA-like mRNA interferase family)
MVSEQPTRKMVKELTGAGWTALRTVGSHTIYGCGCGGHTFSLPDGHKTISPWVVRKCRNAIEECKG